MTKINFYTEKGNVSAKARKHIKDSVIAKIISAFENAGLKSEVNADGGLSIAVAQTEQNEIIYFHLDSVVSTRNPQTKTAKSKKKTAKTVSETVELPDIFATENEEA